VLTETLRARDSGNGSAGSEFVALVGQSRYIKDVMLR
jgi:hypothetical protein